MINLSVRGRGVSRRREASALLMKKWRNRWDQPKITVERRGAANPSWVQTSASKVLPGHPLQSYDIEWGGKVSRKPNERAFLFNFILRENKDKSTYETLRCLQEQASRKEEKTSSELKMPFSWYYRVGPRAVNNRWIAKESWIGDCSLQQNFCSRL